MLDTLLDIGKILRRAGRLRDNRYIKTALHSTTNIPTVYFSLPVSNDFSFVLSCISKIKDETFIKNKLFYLTYKSSDADSSMKYLWGDIIYGVIKGKEQGYYRMGNPKAKNAFAAGSFVRGVEDAKSFKGTKIEKFRKSFDENRSLLENFLKEECKEKFCYLHFDFEGKQWHQFEEELRAIDNKFLENFVKTQNNKFVLRKSLYKTLASAEKNLSFPDFTEKNIYKTKAFESPEQVLDLLYAIDYSTKTALLENDIKVIVLPKGENLQPEQIEGFFDRSRLKKSSLLQSIKKASTTEIKIKSKIINQLGFFDSLFEPFLCEVPNNICQFDIIFSKSGSVYSPDVDLIELSGIRRDYLLKVASEVERVKQKVEKERKKALKNAESGFLDIRRSFLNILDDKTQEKKKYQRHLLTVLPKIYTGTYTCDDILLPAFIEKIQDNIRNDGVHFNLLKFDYKFLALLRKNGETQIVDMQDSKSYQVGILLGQLTKPIALKIKSFEKLYLGSLSRHISDKQSLIAFINFINEKLLFYEKANPNLRQKFVELLELLNTLDTRDYHRNFCSFGFFEGYFVKIEKPEKDTITKTAKSI